MDWNRLFALVLLLSDHSLKICLGPRGRMSQDQGQTSTHSRQHRELQVLFCKHTHTHTHRGIHLDNPSKRQAEIPFASSVLLTDRLETDKTLSRRRRRKMPVVDLIGSVSRAFLTSKCIFPLQTHYSLTTVSILSRVCGFFPIMWRTRDTKPKWNTCLQTSSSLWLFSGPAPVASHPSCTGDLRPRCTIPDGASPWQSREK